MKVQDILQKKSSDLFTLQPHQTLLEASQMLTTHNIGALVVVNEKNHLIGIISERDIVHQLAQHGEVMGKLTVNDVMTTDVLIAVPDDDVTYLSNTMTNNRIRHIPVLQDGELVGIVSIGDVVKAQLDLYEGEARYLQNYITGGYT
jgi:CBS domain-containing protein